MSQRVCRDLVCDLYVDNFARAERLHRAAGLRKRVEPLYFDSPNLSVHTL